VRADIEGNRRGILILTVSAKQTLSFLLLITLSLFVLLLAIGQHGVAYAADN
jgi:hypothetical protein